MKGITIEDIYLMVKYDIGADNENPQRHIEKYVKRMCEKQREICADQISEESKDDSLIYEQTEAIRNLVKIAPEPKF